MNSPRTPSLSWWLLPALAAILFTGGCSTTRTARTTPPEALPPLTYAVVLFLREGETLDPVQRLATMGFARDTLLASGLIAPQDIQVEDPVQAQLVFRARVEGGQLVEIAGVAPITQGRAIVLNQPRRDEFDRIWWDAAYPFGAPIGYDTWGGSFPLPGPGWGYPSGRYDRRDRRDHGGRPGRPPGDRPKEDRPRNPDDRPRPPRPGDHVTPPTPVDRPDAADRDSRRPRHPLDEVEGRRPDPALPPRSRTDFPERRPSNADRPRLETREAPVPRHSPAPSRAAPPPTVSAPRDRSPSPEPRYSAPPPRRDPPPPPARAPDPPPAREERQTEHAD